jgi:hypothetical protein
MTANDKAKILYLVQMEMNKYKENRNLLCFKKMYKCSVDQESNRVMEAPISFSLLSIYW